jgi:hypothetical protein
MLARDMPTVLSNVRFQGAGSTGRRNTGVKSLRWGFKLQGLTTSNHTKAIADLRTCPTEACGGGDNEKTDLREIFGAAQFSTFSTASTHLRHQAGLLSSEVSSMSAA